MNTVSREDIDHLLKATTDSTKAFVEGMFNSVQSRLNQLFAENVELNVVWNLLKQSSAICRMWSIYRQVVSEL